MSKSWPVNKILMHWSFFFLLSDYVSQFLAISTIIKYYYSFNPFKVFPTVFRDKTFYNWKSSLRTKTSSYVNLTKAEAWSYIPDKDTYVTKMVDLISDRTKFENISISIKKYTLKIEDKINNFLRKLKDENIISSETYSKLYTTGSSPGILYGLPKINKPDFCSMFQFRPIFSVINTLGYKISKYLVSILNNICDTTYTVDNSYAFVSKISHINNVNECFLASFDVSNLLMYPYMRLSKSF